MPAARLQPANAGPNVPVLFVVNATIPVGVVGTEEVSVTVAVQVAAVPTVTELDAHVTNVVVVWSGAGVAAKRNAPLLEA